MSDGFTPTTEAVREGYSWNCHDNHIQGNRHAMCIAFDRWLTEHDRKVLLDYEARRKPDPIHIDNIDGVNAGEWLKTHDEEVRQEVYRTVNLSPWAQRNLRAQTLQDAADDIQALHPGEQKNSVDWLRARAAELLAEDERVLKAATS